MTVTHIQPAQTETFSFDWGSMKWFVSPVTIPGAANSQGEVIINPGQGHARHLHEHADELIYVISGHGHRRPSGTRSSRSPRATRSTSRWRPCTPP